MKSRVPTIKTRLLVASLLTVATFVTAGQESFAASPPIDPTHAAHVAAGAMPPDAAKGDPELSQQLSRLQAQVARLEARLAGNIPAMAAAPGSTAMSGMPAAPASATPAMGMGMDKMKSNAAMPGMGAGAMAAPSMAGMGGGAPSAGGMMGMMDKMMGLMDKMMSMDSGAPMPSGGGKMGMGKMKMGSMGNGGPMPTTPPGAGLSSMGGGTMGMMGMMEMGGGSMTQSALPGFPGASHLYHVGATGFFLDHPQHIALTTDQQAALNKAKEEALLAKSTSDRAIQQAEQELWTLTAADQPDAAKIQEKLAEIGKLTGDARFSFIRSVGEASSILTDEQRKALTGFAPPASNAPAAAPMAGMKDM